MLSLVPFDRLKDGPNIFKPGYSFLTEPDNASILKPGFTEVIANLETDPDRGNLMVALTATVGSLETLIKPNIKKPLHAPVALIYEATCDKFLELLLTILVTSGCPPYGEDLLHVLLTNEEVFQGGVLLMNGQVVIVTSNGHPTNRKLEHRFLPDLVGQMLLLYITDVLPLRRDLSTATAGFKANNNVFAMAQGEI